MAKKTINVKIDEKTTEKVDKRRAALFDEEIRYIIAKIKRAKNDEVCHYSYLLTSTLEAIKKMGIEVRQMGQHSYGFTVPNKKSGAWRKMCMYGKEMKRDEKGHFVKG